MNKKKAPDDGSNYSPRYWIKVTITAAIAGIISWGVIALINSTINPQKPPTQTETKKETPQPENDQRTTLHQQSPPRSVMKEPPLQLHPKQHVEPQINQLLPAAPQPQKDGSITLSNSPNSIATINQQGNNYIGQTYPMEKWTIDGSVKFWENPTHVNAFIGQKRKEFDEMSSLQEKRNYSDLTVLCKKQITETPKWLTPYLFLGVAQVNMGLREEAITNLKYVMANSPNSTLDPDNPMYQEALRILKLLEK